MSVSGKRVLVTRPKHQMGRLDQELTAKGAIPVLLPATEVTEPVDSRPLDLALASLHEFQWVVFTSVNGVEAAARHMAALDIPASAMTERRIAVVGPATAAAVETFWKSPEAMPSEYVAEAVAEVMFELPGSNVLLLRGDLARLELPEMLAERGANVLDVTAYRVVRRTEAVELTDADRPDAITLTSGEAARATIDRLRSNGLDIWLHQVPIAVIGPLTAEAVRSEGYVPAVVADRHTIDGLVEALELLFARATAGVGA